MSEKSVIIQIGNSDNKLTQQEWSNFYERVFAVVNTKGHVHFAGSSVGTAPWQNACIAASVPEYSVADLTTVLTAIREQYQQDSVAVLIGDTQFI